MGIEFWIVVFIITLITEAILSSFKHFYWGLMLPVVTVIVLLCTALIPLYQLLLLESVVYFVTRIAFVFINTLMQKYKLSQVDRLKIKDL